MTNAFPLFRKFLFSLCLLSLTSLTLLSVMVTNARAEESSSPSATSASSALFKPEDGFGIGFVLGTPTGISGSLPLGNLNAINATVGWNLGKPANVFAQADYVWFTRDIAPVESGSFSAYYGPGVFTEVSRNPTMGIHAVAGVEYRFAAAPVQTFLELSPGITVLPSTEATVGAGLGVRYFF